jgi:uncharacterized membrane protein YgaE (UPF0421/DUF939 family)
MNGATAAVDRSAIEWLPALSDRLKVAIKHALAFMLAYFIPLGLEWSTQASTAAITVIVISTTAAGTGNAFYKGILRVLGTLLGAVAGIGLIALFPQERMLYLLLLSLMVTLFLYLARAYKGDNTVFFLAIFAMLMVFKNGEVDAVFLYGVDRTAMTLFGVIVYTLVMIFLWPGARWSAMPAKKAPSLLSFDWSSPENLKGAFLGFLVFWAAAAYWIWFNPPMGFMIVALATALSALTLLSPVTPTMLIVAFTIGFVFATLAYVFVLPHLHYGWQLALFLFLYALAAHYFLPPPVTLNVLIATSTFYLQNTMGYDFALFLTILLVLYSYLFILLLFYYIPLSSKPERLFETMRRRFEAIASRLTAPQKPRGWWAKLVRRYDCERLLPTAGALQFWATKLDASYYGLEKERLAAWAESCMEAARKLHALRCGGAGSETKAQEALRACREMAESIPFEALKKGRF